MNTIKQIIKKLIRWKYATSESYCKYLRKCGCKIGERVEFFPPKSVLIDVTRPWLIDIGNDVQLTRGVMILTHGYDWSVLKGKYGEVLGSSGGVSIGNNVFIGVNTVILKGVHIGNNVIIGACSLVNRDIPDNCVAAGNPAKVIMSLDEYHEKRIRAQEEESAELVKKYFETYGQEPDDHALNEFFWLFTNKKSDLCSDWDKQMKLVGNYDRSLQLFETHKPLYKNRDEFIKQNKSL